MQEINARQARQRFSRLLSDATRGASVAITRHGRQIAKIVPAGAGGRKKLPNLAKFRATISRRGKSLSEDVASMRSQERF